jgi:hypothetical protein
MVHEHALAYLRTRVDVHTQRLLAPTPSNSSSSSGGQNVSFQSSLFMYMPDNEVWHVCVLEHRSSCNASPLQATTKPWPVDSTWRPPNDQHRAAAALQSGTCRAPR